MPTRPCFVLAFAFLLAPGIAAACDPRASAVYQEDAPQDTLTLVNESASVWALSRIEIDLVEAKGALVFDVAPGGRGINQHQQPVGRDLRAPPTLTEADRKLTLSLTPLGPGGRSVFYLDLDDMGPDGGVYVALEDLEGARLRAWFEGPGGAEAMSVGAFDAQATARLSPEACV